MLELFDALEIDKKNNGAQVPSEMTRLRRDWNGYQAMDVNGATIARWAGKLSSQGLSPKTVRNNLQLLDQAFRLARQQERLAYAPVVKKPRVPENARNGTFSPEEFERLVAVLPAHLQDFCRWGYFTGWRAGSIRSLRWEDIRDGELTCRAQYSKDRRAHTIPIEGSLAEIITRREKERKGDYVFHYQDGRPIGDYKRAWRTALKTAGLPHRMFHDFRRTAATNLRRAGVSEEVAMKITGHSTNTMFKRYRIVDSGDVRRALEARTQYEATLLREAPAATARLQ